MWWAWCVRVVWSACQHVADNAPTSLSLAHRCVSRRARTARQSQDCLRVRSLSDPRLCAKVAQLAGALSATVGTGATALRGCVSLRHRATAFHPARCIHPRMRLAWLGRDTSRRPATPPRGVCRARAADCALAPLACAPPLARCRYMPVFARRKRRRLAPLSLSHFCASHNLGAGWILSPPSALTMREAWRGGGDTRRSKRRRRDAADAANAVARRDGRYSDQAPRAAVADGWRALRRMRAR